MGGFFNLDGPFYKYGGLIADTLIVSVLWIVFCIPIVTIGAATSAAYYVMTRRISDKEKYVIRDFWTSFKRNLKTGTLVHLSIALLGVILYFNIANIGVTGNMSSILLPFQFCFAIEGVFLTVYVYPIISRFEMGYKEVFKSSFFMANRHLLTTILNVLLLAGLVLLTFIMPVMMFFAPGVYFLSSSYFFMKLFKKYRPEMDKELSAEELRQKLIEQRAEEESGETEEKIFDDAQGLLIEKQAGEKSKKEKRRNK